MYIPPNVFREALEKETRKLAKKIEKNYKLPGPYTIVLKQSKDNTFCQDVAIIKNGQIAIVLPHSVDEKEYDFRKELEETKIYLEKTIKRIFARLEDPDLFKDHDIFNPTYISDTMIRLVPDKRGKLVWHREKFDPSLVNGHRKKEFEVEIITTKQVIFKHKKTGIFFSVTDKRNRPEWEVVQECWAECSELVEEELERLEKERQKTLPVLYSLLENTKLWMWVEVERLIEKAKKPKKVSIFSQWKPKERIK